MAAHMVYILKMLHCGDWGPSLVLQNVSSNSWWSIMLKDPVLRTRRRCGYCIRYHSQLAGSCMGAWPMSVGGVVSISRGMVGQLNISAAFSTSALYQALHTDQHQCLDCTHITMIQWFVCLHGMMLHYLCVHGLQ